MKVVVTCQSPLNHGAFGESAGNATLIRRMPLVALEGMPRVPVVSGNALRGVCRRIVFRDLFSRSGLDRTSLDEGLWDRLYAALANGGHLETAETRMDPGRIREVRESLPPLSVFGAALYSWLLPGHMSVGILWPRCRETYEAGLVSEPGQSAAEDLVDEVTQVRHVERDQQNPDVSGVTPMPTTLETIGTGAVLESEVTFADHASEIERAAVVYGLRRITALGGKSSSGLGRVSVADLELSEESYTAWLDDTHDLADRLRNLAESLGKVKPKKGKGKKA